MLINFKNNNFLIILLLILVISSCLCFFNIKREGFENTDSDNIDYQVSPGWLNYKFSGGVGKAAKGDDIYECLDKLKDKNFAVVGHRNSLHPRKHYRNTCYAYRNPPSADAIVRTRGKKKNIHEDILDSESDKIHQMACTNGNKIENLCKSEIDEDEDKDKDKDKEQDKEDHNTITFNKNDIAKFLLNKNNKIKSSCKKILPNTPVVNNLVSNIRNSVVDIRSNLNSNKIVPTVECTHGTNESKDLIELSEKIQ